MGVKNVTNQQTDGQGVSRSRMDEQWSWMRWNSCGENGDYAEANAVSTGLCQLWFKHPLHWIYDILTIYDMLSIYDTLKNIWYIMLNNVYILTESQCSSAKALFAAICLNLRNCSSSTGKMAKDGRAPSERMEAKITNCFVLASIPHPYFFWFYFCFALFCFFFIPHPFL